MKISNIATQICLIKMNKFKAVTFCQPTKPDKFKNTALDKDVFKKA